MFALLRNGRDLLGHAYRQWTRDNAMMFAAAVAFYATFSLAPLLVLLLSAGGLVFGEGAARMRLVDFIGDVAGGRTARAADRLIEAVSQTDTGTTIISTVVLILAASAVFRHLKAALNIVLDVPDRDEGGVLPWLKQRVFAVIVVVACILLFLAALGGTAAIEWSRANIPEAVVGDRAIWRTIELAAAVVLLTVVFGGILRFVPDVRLKWRHVAVAGFLAAIVFTAGQFLIGLYLARRSFTSAYGAAGSVVLLLFYIYFTVAILLAAAEVTEVFARRDAEFRGERRRAQSELPYTPRKSSA